MLLVATQTSSIVVEENDLASSGVMMSLSLSKATLNDTGKQGVGTDAMVDNDDLHRTEALRELCSQGSCILEGNTHRLLTSPLLG